MFLWFTDRIPYDREVMIMQIKPEETLLRGYWIDLGSSVVPDANWDRISRLTAEYLELMASSSDGMDLLYRDPADGRLWELTRIAPEMRDGGPPLLAVVDPVRAAEKYCSR
jgi:hypothetical protein